MFNIFLSLFQYCIVCLLDDSWKHIWYTALSGIYHYSFSVSQSQSLNSCECIKKYMYNTVTWNHMEFALRILHWQKLFKYVEVHLKIWDPIYP